MVEAVDEGGVVGLEGGVGGFVKEESHREFCGVGAESRTSSSQHR